MAIVPMTKERFIDRWQEDAIEKRMAEAEKRKREKTVMAAYITERMTQRLHNYHRKNRNGRLGGS